MVFSLAFGVRRSLGRISALSQGAFRVRLAAIPERSGRQGETAIL